MMITKNICDDFDLLMVKSLVRMVVEFHVHNTSEFMFLFHITFTDLVNLTPVDNTLEKNINVPPCSTFKFSEFEIEGSYSYKYKFSYQRLNPGPTVKTEQIDQKLLLKITQEDIKHRVTFDLVNDRPEVVKFQLSFKELVNIRDLNEGKMIYCVTAPPRSEVQVCSLVFDGEWTYSYSHTHSLVPNPVDLSSLKTVLNRDVAESHQICYRTPIHHLDLTYLCKVLAPAKFIDPFFPPGHLSISDNYLEDTEVHWRRPEEFALEEVTVLPQEFQQFKLLEGSLKCDWLKCVLCKFSVDELMGLFENTQVNPLGVYRVYLYSRGLKTSATIDDYIPCSPGLGPIFTRSMGSDIWVMLLEKALAQQKGGYEQLNFYSGTSALIDLTGQPVLQYSTASCPDLWKSLKRWNQSEFSIIVQTATETGEELYFTVVGIDTLQGLKLIKFANPFVNFNKVAQWTRVSPRWTENMRQALTSTFEEKTGSFWMDAEDVTTLFPYVLLTSSKEMNVHRFSTLISRTDTGGVSSHYISLHVDETTELFVGIHQEDDIVAGAKEYRGLTDLGFVILNLKNSAIESGTTKNQVAREVFTNSVLEPGEYLIIPLSSAFVLHQPATELPIVPLVASQVGFHPKFKFVLHDLFARLALENGVELSFEEFDYINQRLELGIGRGDYVSQVLNKYASLNGLTFQGLIEFFAEALNAKGEQTIREWMTLLGYDEYMRSIESKPITVSIHSDTFVETDRESLSTELAHLAMEEYIDLHGTVEVAEDQLYIKRLEHDHGLSFLAANKSTEQVSLALDFLELTNATLSGSCHLSLPPKTRMAFQHLTALERGTPITYTLQLSRQT